MSCGRRCDREKSDFSRFRRNKLPPRQDFQGVEQGILFQENRALSLTLLDFERGVLIQIVSGAVRTRERMHRHGRHDLADNAVCLSAHCQAQGLRETREHRWWHCPDWDDLRPQWFKDMRSQLGSWPQCVVQRALAPLGYEGPPIAQVQRVFLNIELAIRAMYEKGLKTQTPQPPPAPAPERRIRLHGKQPAPAFAHDRPAYDAAESHPPEACPYC